MEDARYKLDDFELYQFARRFRISAYRVARQIPPDERYNLGQQMRRAALSITNNIAEGHGRWHYQENIQFCRIARGSAEEVLDDLNTCLDEAYAVVPIVEELKERGYDLVKKINGYIAYLRRSKQGGDAA